MKRVYFDHCRSTFVEPEVLDEMKVWMTEKYWAPAQFTSTGTEVWEAVEEAQVEWASYFGGKPDEIHFAPSEIVAANISIVGLLPAGKKVHVISTKIESGSTVLSILRGLKREGRIDLTLLDVDSNGFVDPDDLRKAVRPDTHMLVLGRVNYMVGTIQDVEGLAKIAKEVKEDIKVVIDDTKSIGKVPVIDYASFADVVFTDPARIHGPKGAAPIWVKKGISIRSPFFGSRKYSSVVRDRWNVPAIRGSMVALRLMRDNHEAKLEKMARLQKMIIDGLLERVPETDINGPWPEGRSPANVCVTFRYIEGEAVQMYLDMAGIVVDTGSACADPFLQANHVILALYNDYARAHGSITLVLSWHNTEEDVERFLEVIPGVVATLRKISPLAPEVYKK